MDEVDLRRLLKLAVVTFGTSTPTAETRRKCSPSRYVARNLLKEQRLEPEGLFRRFSGSVEISNPAVNV